ncbi:uncharacterized protein LOC131359569 [Hemibagrus wyckioides]|uniref:uncharacterized protein LOC131359569 n=1 Tax=Hemibagrus wyckioides TaxID=337641 RepID=UPI00266D67F1|nr:uncharacterized protein LOC131359569 [Hemibagrus wyckioides]
MDLADKLCTELFRWIAKQEECAEHLMDLAEELEEMTKAMNKGQLVGNTTTVVGSAALIGTGIATFLTGGLAAPLLVMAAGVAAGVGTVTSVTCKLLESWKCSKTMKNAQKTAEELEEIQKNIEMLQKKLSEDCKSQDLEEITARILRAMAKRSGRDLSLSHLIRLTQLLRIDPLNTQIYTETILTTSMGCMLLPIIHSVMFMKTAATKGAEYITKGVATISLKTALKGTGQVTGGVFGLVLTLPDLIDNCEQLVKNKHETEASKNLRTKAAELRDAVTNIKKQMNELQEMLSEIPETKCHVDLATEMCGNQKYTRGTVRMEYKQTKNQDSKVREFTLISTKDMISSTSKHNLNKNQRQKTESSKKKPRQKKILLPRITMSNVHSLPNKMEEIKEMMWNDYLFSNDLMFFTETWLNNNSPPISLDGYRSVRGDRDPELTQKRRGGGLIIFVNKKWATNVGKPFIKNTPNYELMDVPITPNVHPENAPPLIFILVYVPGPNFDQAATVIANCYSYAQARSHGPIFLLGDFNRTPLLRNLEQYVTCPTRYNNTLDLCYGNVPGAYKSVCRPPLGRSDHNVIHLIPKDQYDSFKDGECTHDQTNPSKQ